MVEELPSVFLVGPMGAGKTTIGRLLAKQLGRAFVDSDWYIESQTGADIAWIFAKEGEAGFRERETRAIDELTQKKQIVLATGGGAVMCADNREFLQQRGIVVYLNAPVDVQMARTAKDKSRPLLQQPNPRKILQELYSARVIPISTGGAYNPAYGSYLSTAYGQPTLAAARIVFCVYLYCEGLTNV